MAAVLATENLWHAWSFQPVVIGGGLLAIAFFLHGWRRLRRRRAALAPWTRIPLFVAGVIVTVLAIISPIDAIGERYLQSVHMLQHVLIADLGIALTVVAVRGPLTVFFLPRDLLAPLARIGWLRRLLRFLLRPGVSYGVWVVVLVSWHVPRFYEAALHHRAWHDLMHLSFVVGGLLVWTQIIDPSRHRRLTLSGRLGYAALVFWTGQIMAYVILFDFRPLFPTYVDQPVRLLGLSPLTDQKLAGVVMMVEQVATVGLAFVLLLRAAQRRRMEDLARRRPVGMTSPWAPTFEPLFVVLGGGALWAYARAARREWPGRARAAAFGSGVLLIVLALNSPLETIAVDYLVLFHLLQNVIISDWAPLLLILGLTPGMQSAIAERGGRPFAFLTRPTIALPIWLVGWYAVHLGGVYDAALRQPALLNVEHLFMIGIGLLFWWPVLSDAPRSVPTLGRIAYVFAAFVGSAFLGIALTFAPPLYGYYEARPERLWGITAVQDQNLGGILMTTEQALIFFAMITWLLVRLFREEDEAERALRAEQRARGLL